MVHENIQSALIFEDDADWDVALKSQMREVARGTRFLANSSDDITRSPYGDGWDIIWIGHCCSKPDYNDNRRWVIPRDPTVLPPKARWEFEKPDMSPWETGSHGDTSTRIMYIQEWGFCTSAYAISLRGAEKVIYRQSMQPFNDAIDNGLGHMCSEKVLNFTCIAPFPTIIGISKPAGSSNRGSDLGHVPGEETFHPKSQSLMLMFPVGQNIERLIHHDSSFLSQFPEVSGPEMSFDEITGAVGHAEYLPDGKEEKEQREMET